MSRSLATDNSPRLIVLGKPEHGDDAAALLALDRLPGPYLCPGRPGAELSELLDRPTVLVEVVCTGSPPGTIIELPLCALGASSLPSDRPPSASAADALRAARSSGYTPPEGFFVGIEGERFALGTPPSRALDEATGALVAAVWRAWRELSA